MANSLEQFVNNVRSFSAQGGLSSLHEYVIKTRDVLVRHGPHLDTVLATLDLSQHSLGVLAILCVKISQAQSQDFDTLFPQIQEFIHGCNGEHVRFATDLYAELCHSLTSMLVARNEPMRGILLLQRAISRIQLSESQLTSVHSDLFQLCLLAKCPKPALQYLNIDITDICKENNNLDPVYFLQYYYYGGMIYLMLKKNKEALYFFHVCLTTPAMAVSHVMLEAYKKFILVSLILNGKVGSLPKYTSQVVTRFFKALAFPYNELALAHSRNSPNELRTLMNKHQGTFNSDKNMGLVKQVLSSLYKKSIQRLTRTFLTLSLADMASRVQLSSPQEAEQYVLSMIEEGEIFATINQKDGMVVFHDNPEKYNGPAMLRTIDKEMSLCMALDKKLQQMEEEITVNPQYVQKSSGVQEEDGKPGGSGAVSSGTISYAM